MKYTEIERTYIRARQNVLRLMERYDMVDRCAIPLGIEKSFCNKFKVYFTKEGDIKNLGKVEERLDTLSEKERREWKRRG